MSLRIVLATATPLDRMETFVRAQMERLDRVVLVLADGNLPTRTGDGALVMDDGFAAKLQRRVRKVLGGDPNDGHRRKLTTLLRACRADVVLAQYGPTANALREVCRRADVPLVVHFHGFDAYVNGVRANEGLYHGLWRDAAAVVAVSRDMREQLIAMGAPDGRTFLNPCGVDTGLFIPGNAALAPPHFIAVGRFVDKKAPHLVLSAFERLLSKVPDARLTMVGRGPLWESCVQRVRSMEWEGRVDLAGVKSPADVATLMQGAKAFVQHSVRALDGDSEGTPVSVLEAMASGLPVIATRHMGIADVVEHGEHGLLCEEFDTDTMATNMERVALDGDLAGRMGRAGRERAERDHRMGDRIAALQAILREAAGH